MTKINLSDLLRQWHAEMERSAPAAPPLAELERRARTHEPTRWERLQESIRAVTQLSQIAAVRAEVRSSEPLPMTVQAVLEGDPERTLVEVLASTIESNRLTFVGRLNFEVTTGPS